MNKLPKVMMVITFASVLTLGLAMAGCSSGSTSSDGEGLPTYQLEINLLGENNEFPVDSQGMLKAKVEVSSTDGRISLSINKGAIVLDKDEKPLRSIRAVVDRSPPLPPENAYIVSPVYDLEPKGATFNPGLLLTLSYDPNKLPDGLKENDLYVAYHDDTKWCMPLYKKVNTKLHSATTDLHDFNFTNFAILGPKGLAPPNSSTPTQGTKVGNLAPNFQFHDPDGKPTSLRELQGKPIMLNFWSTRCPPCVFEMPYIQQVYDGWSPKGLVLLAINMGGTPSQVQQFLQSNNLSLPVLLDTRNDVAQRYNIRYMPTTFFIDKQGIIRVVKIGAFPNKEAIESDLNKIMP